MSGSFPVFSDCLFVQLQNRESNAIGRDATEFQEELATENEGK
jgi:hypothetical protein